MTGNNLPPGLDHTHPNLAGCDDYYDIPEPEGEDESLPPGCILCPECGGSGEHETGERESDTGYALTVSCPKCSAQGFVRERPAIPNGGKNGN